MNKIVFFVLLSIISSVIILPIQQAAAALPPGITCSNPTARFYPDYYTYCTTGQDRSDPIPTGANHVNATYYYQSFRDEYRVDYKPPAGVSWYQLYYVSPTDVVFTGDYAFQPTGTHYLTCNGSYKLKFFSSSDTLLYETQEMITTDIVNPSCLSYSDGIEGEDDLSATYTPGATPDTYDLDWQPEPGATDYDIYVNGELVGTTTTPGMTIDEKGSVTIIAKDENGDTIGQSDLMTPSIEESEIEYGAPPAAGCDVCEKIAAALECPEWDTYMGELTGAIKNALPTLPEWRTIADQFIDAFDEYAGDPPAVPNPTNITPEIPTLDTNFPEAEIEIVVPEDFNTPFVFDITSAPPIEIVDGSEPFEILEPDSQIDSDDPGEFVFPGDERNHSDGIKQPDSVDTGYETPTPTTQAPPEDPEIPPSDIPTPTPTTPSEDPEIPPSDIPIPTGTGGEYALPTTP